MSKREGAILWIVVGVGFGVMINHFTDSVWWGAWIVSFPCGFRAGMLMSQAWWDKRYE